MILVIIKDMTFFLIVLFYATFGFTLIRVCLTNNDFISTFIYVYRADLGDFNTDEFSDLSDWIWFFVVSFVNPLILLNMLIALMADTYDKVQENQDITDLREMATVILECEALMFWKKNCKGKRYFQVASYWKTCKGNGETWQGKIKEIKTEISVVKKALDSQEREFSNKLTHIQKEVKIVSESLSFKIDAMNRKLDALV